LLLPREKLLRLGTRYGGWIIPVDSGLGPASICYCAGAGEDISFDCALVMLFCCKVRIMDPTPRAVDHFRKLADSLVNGTRFPVNNDPRVLYEITHDKFQLLSFLPVGLSDRDQELKFFLPKNPDHVSCSVVNLQKTKDYFVARCCRLAAIMQQHGDASIDLLKMDIEGSEYAVINDMVSTGLLPRLLLIEFDEVNAPLDNKSEDRIRAHIEMLVKAGMQCVAVEGCNATFVRK
jgi:FkbM family methyltransferase